MYGRPATDGGGHLLLGFAERAQAAGANADLAIGAIHRQPRRLNVRCPLPRRAVLRMAHIVPELHVLAADFTSTGTSQFPQPPLRNLSFAVSWCQATPVEF